jgi:hypothetical protein
MLFHFNEDVLDESKNLLRKRWSALGSGHCDEAIAAGLGFRTHAHLRATLARTPELVRPISDAALRARLVVLKRGSQDHTLLAFDKRLAGLPIVNVFPADLNGNGQRIRAPLLETACLLTPERLEGQNHQEGILAAVATDLKAQREHIGTERPGTSPRTWIDESAGVSVDLEYLGRNEFEVTVKFNSSDDYLFGGAAHFSTICGLLERRFEPIAHLVSVVAPDHAPTYRAPETEGEKAVQRDPSWDIGIYIDDIGFQVWPRAIGRTRLDETGSFAGRDVTLIDDRVYAQIRDELQSHRSWGCIGTKEAHHSVFRQSSPLPSGMAAGS